MNVHPNLTDLAPLIGTWRGTGHGEYPTITSFDYDDEWVFGHTGKPFIAFVERTRIGGEARHTESGYLRGTASGLEIVASLPTGQVELGRGEASVTGGALVIATDAAVQNTPTAKRVDRIVRRFRVDGDVLDYTMDMEAVGVGLTLHLTARLIREA